MNSLRKWLYRPKKTDQSLLAQFFFADEDLNAVATELDSFDGRKDPDRCTALVNHLRQCQDKVLNICQLIMDEVIPEDRAPRDFRAKFPDDVLQENLAGQLWFGAECLAAGSSILNRELESTTMRPLAKALTKSLENVRNLLREQCFRNPPEFTEKICESLKILDRLFAEFELSYVSAMVPVKTVHEYEAQQAITVLFSETLQRALGLSLLSQDQVDSCDPALMFTIPRLAIVAGLLIFPDGPLCLDRGELSDMFRPFRSLLLKIRELLWTLSRSELSALERALCSMEEPNLETNELLNDCKSELSQSDDDINEYSPAYQRNSGQTSYTVQSQPDVGCNRSSISEAQNTIQDYLDQIYKDFPDCKQFISDLVCHTRDRESPPSSIESRNEIESDGFEATRRQLDFQLLANAMAVAHANVTGLQTLRCQDELENDTSHTTRSESPTGCNFSDALDTTKTEDFEENSNNTLGEQSLEPETSGRVNGTSGDLQSSRSSMCDSDSIELTPASENSNEQEKEVSIKIESVDSDFAADSKARDKRNIYLVSEFSQGQTTNSEISVTNMSGVISSSPMGRIKIRDTEHWTYDEQDGAKATEGERTEIQDYNNTSCDNPSNITSNQINNKEDHSARPLHVGDKTLSFSSCEDDLPTPVVEVSSDCPIFIQSVPQSSKLHSSGSSQDSGLSSMADCEKLSSPSMPSGSNEAEHNSSLHSVPSTASCSSVALQIKKPTSSDQSTECSSKSLKRSNCTDDLLCSTVDCGDFSASTADDRKCETMSFDSECQDDIEIALAMQAAEIATRNEARARFKNSADLIHRLFICISGVADQLQTNYAADLRSTLKCVFAVNATPLEESPSLNGGGSSSNEADVTPEPSLDEDLHEQSYGDERVQYQHIEQGHQATEVISPPSWVPDELAPQCMACLASFTVVRRRHHCRNCGKVFCGKCSGNSVPLPRYGHLKPVRVCNRCYMYCVTPFTIPGTPAEL